VVGDYSLHRLTFFDLATRTWLGGGAATATLPTPPGPADIVVDRKRHRFYLPATQVGLVLAIDSRTGRFANGTLENSSIDVAGGRPMSGGIAIDPALDRIFFGVEDRLRAIDLERFTLVEAELLVGTHRGVATDPRTGRVYVASSEYHTVIHIDGRTMAYAFGDLERSSVATDRTPFAIALDGATNRLFVSCMSTQRIQILETAAPRHTDLPPLEAAAATRTFAFVGEGLLAASSFDDGEVNFIDTRTGGYSGGDRAASALAVAKGARGLAWIGGGPLTLGQEER